MSRILKLKFAAFFIAATAASPVWPVSATESSQQWLSEGTQMVLVLTDNWQQATGTLHTFERHQNRWQPIASAFDVSIGKNGSAWGIGLHPVQNDAPQKVEGDGKAPAGIFAIDIAFGYAEKSTSKLRYHAMTDADWCIDVVESPLYNQIVSTGHVGLDAVKGSTEPMRRDLQANADQLYKKGFVIKHNPDNIRKSGSCIFAHLWRAPGKPTAGCTAMSENDMNALLHWLDADKNPSFVLLPKSEYTRLQKSWHLPPLKN